MSHSEYAALPTTVAESREGQPLPPRSFEHISRQSTLGSQTTDNSDDVYEDARENWAPDPSGKDIQLLVLPPDTSGNITR